MSQENVEVVRRFLAMPLDRAGIAEVCASVCDPEVEYHPVRGYPEAAPCYGRAAYIDFLAGIMAAYRSLQWEPLEVVPVDDDEGVLAHTLMRAEGRNSGIESTAKLYLCFWLRGGRIYRAEDHLTPEGALHAFGMEPGSLEALGIDE